ncbi:MAG: PQQ-binding-like beta-propeller repeat protein [Elusimicrobiota bacterium]|nr:PQQ-binding-like beta-propeller repeat protein [Endomicrobiia bacterium]MDW8165984.1 PQQ-binding-like beta-propeller repeat protein [Elusimicrobiota bacterium]
MNIKKFIKVFLLFFYFILLTYSFSQTPVYVKIISPTDNSEVFGIVTINLEVTDEKRTLKVELYIDDKKVVEFSKSPFKYEWDTTKVEDGIHTILAKVYDRNGNVRSSGIRVNVNNRQGVWQRIYKIGSYIDEINYITIDSDGGYLIIGNKSFEEGSTDILISKTDNEGKLLWIRFYGGDKNEEGYQIQCTKDNGYVVVGYTNSFGKGGKDIYILKLNSEGNLEWEKTFGGTYDEEAYSVQQTKDGGYIIGGYTKSFSKDKKSQAYIIKLDGEGNKTWEKIYNYYIAFFIQQTSDGGYIVACGDGFSIYILKLDTNGDEIWGREYYEGEYWEIERNIVTSIQQTSDGGYILAGGTGYNSNYKTYIIKISQDGYLEWKKIFEKSYEEEFSDWNENIAYNIQQTKDKGYIVVGIKDKDIYVVKLDQKGKLIWQKTFNGLGDNIPYLVNQVEDEGYLVIGYTESIDIKGLYSIKLDKDGNTGPLIIGEDIDKTPPQIEIISPKDGEVVSGEVKIQVQARDNVWVKKIEFYVNEKKIEEVAESIYEFIWDTENYKEKPEHKIIIKAYDEAGNVVIDEIILKIVGALEWKFKTGGDVYSSPAIGKDGTIYVGSRDDCLYAINPDGTLKWKFKTGNWIESSPAIGKDGTIYVGSYDNYLYAINPDGTLKWKFETGGDVDSSPAIGKDGTIYVGSWDGYLYAINSESLGLSDSPWPKFRYDEQNTGCIVK